jgi:hypothetical protein
VENEENQGKIEDHREAFKQSIFTAKYYNKVRGKEQNFAW